jgi:hypothetical protein
VTGSIAMANRLVNLPVSLASLMPAPLGRIPSVTL